MRTPAATLFAFACIAVSVSSAEAQEQPVSVQMHVHGSLSEGQGTMWGHTARSAENGLDLLWWTDHDNRVSYWNMDGSSTFGWEEGLTGTAPDSGATLRWDPVSQELDDIEVESTNATSFEGQRSLRVAGRAPQGSDWKILAARYRTGSGFHRRSLLSDVWVRLAIRPPADLYTNKDVLVALRLELSSNLEGRTMTITWLAGTGTPPSDDWHTWRSLPPMEPGQWNVVELPITQIALEAFPFGDDNSFRQFYLAVAARDGGRVEAHFDDFQLQVRGVRGQPLLERQRQVVDTRYSETVDHLVGFEITPAGHHLNSFGSAVPLIDYDTYDFSRHPLAAVEHVHAHGGVVSYNHIFGAGGDRGLSPEEQQALIEKKAKNLIANDAYGVDILEVGYQHRGLPIEGHLAVWDALSERNLYVTGNGVTDDHHAQPWEELDNNMVTWLWVEAPTESQYLRALRAGRAFFGDPLLVGPDVSLDMTTPEGFRMGQVVVTDRSSHRINAVIEGLQDGYQVRAVVNGQVAQTYPVHGSRFAGTGTLPTPQDTFLRLEVWTADGRPVLFSNPIWFLRSAPPGGIPEDRASGAFTTGITEGPLPLPTQDGGPALVTD